MPNIIRISRGIEINVNEAGDTICIPVDDMNFIDNYNNVLDTFDRIDKEIKEKEGTLAPKEELRFIIEKTRGVMDGINNLFMDEQCCKKVFGNIVPSPYLLADFFEQLCPYIEKYADERQKKIMDKYRKPVRSRNA